MCVKLKGRQQSIGVVRNIELYNHSIIYQLCNYYISSETGRCKVVNLAVKSHNYNAKTDNVRVRFTASFLGGR